MYIYTSFSFQQFLTFNEVILTLTILHNNDDDDEDDDIVIVVVPNHCSQF